MGAAVEFANAAITDRTAVSAALKGCNVVFHCAYDWADRTANLQGVRNLIEVCVSNEARLVHVSTFAIYDPFPDQKLTEEEPAKGGGSEYSINKLEIDSEIFEAIRSRRLNAVILMPTVVYGANGGTWTRNPVRLLLSGTVILPGGGDGLCNAVHVDDVCQALLLAAVLPAAQGHRYFVSALAPVTWHAFFESYAQIVGCPGPQSESPVAALSDSKRASQVQVQPQEQRSASIRSKIKEMLTSFLRMVTRSDAVRRPASWMLAYLGDRVQRRAKRLFTRHAVPVVHTLDGAFYHAKCHIVIDKIVRELGYAPAYDLERGMAATAVWIRDNFGEEITLMAKRQ
jgi:nucleoside-diphosphate-sugar epimerase